MNRLPTQACVCVCVYLSFYRGALWFQKEIHGSGVCTHVCLFKLRPDAVEIRAFQGNTTVSFPGSDYALSCVLITTGE